MTILAGVLSRDPSMPVPRAACDALKTHISRNPRDQRIEFRHPLAYFVKVDIGAFGRPAHRLSSNGSFAMLAGDPLIIGEGLADGRDAQLAHLHTHLDGGSFACLRSAAGTFCAAYYNPRTNAAHLVSDRLGLRPLYYAVVGELVYFASAMRILEDLCDVPKTMSVVAVAEMTGFGYPFGAGTPYANIRMLEPCEIVTLRRGEIASSRYFDWASIPRSSDTEDEALEEIWRRFESAVSRRLGADTRTFAYLSGGLDSRCVVAALRSRGAGVYTYNFSLPNTQDQVFGREFARKVGAMHEEVPTEPGPDWSGVMAKAWSATRREVERPKVVWTGEGGSVGLGHVYVTPEIVSALHARNIAGAIDAFLAQQNRVVLSGVLHSAIADELRGYLHARLRQELDAIGHPDPLRNFYIFLNLNGPRRHLEEHFDTIDRHRLEYQVPFYDSNLLEYLTSIAAEPCLYHRLYVKWLSFFSPAVVEVPWQAYPGHVASPIPVPDEVPDQWTAPASAAHQAAVQRDLLARSAAMLSAPDFPSAILRRRRLRLMWWACRLKVADYGYAMSAALEYYRYWKVSCARYDLSAAVQHGSRRPQARAMARAA